MALDAGRPRVHGGRVLVLMAGRTGLGHALALGRVGRADLLVAIGARSTLGRLVFVRVVAAQAFLSAVHLDSRQLALWLSVAALAVTRPERRNQGRLAATTAEAARTLREAWLIERRQRRFTAAIVDREGMAVGAVCGRARTQAQAGFRAGVLDARLLGVAGGAALRRHRAHAALLERVTAATGDAVLQHVHAMAGHGAGHVPSLLHADARAPALVSTGREQRGHQEGRDQPEDR